jgi:Mg-chelatase subunit ChlD
MNGLRISFDQPAYLLLLLLIPVLWWMSYRSLAVLGATRRLFAIFFRTAVLSAIIAALAGIQLVWTTERITVMYLLDQSESIPQERRMQMLDFVSKSVKQHRDASREDRAGVIVFGRNAAIEVPPFNDDVPLLRQTESDFGRTDGTNLEEAFELAHASMPEDSRRRIVIVTDGNETIGDAKAVAARLASSGIGIDVVPAPLTSGADVLVEKIDLPADIRNGQPFEARVVISNYVAPGNKQSTKGRLSITRNSGGEDQLLVDDEIELVPGKNVIPLRHTIDQPAPFTFKAKFTPYSAGDDAQSQNNEAAAYTYVRGKGRVLIIEPADSPGEHALIIEQLRKSEIEVVVQNTSDLFGSLAELQAFDAVVLAGVPRTSGDSADSLVQFSDDQLQMLVRNTQQLGAGLLMIGGPESLGAGGWTRTPIEEAMPVDFEIKNSKVVAVGALMLVIDSSGSMSGEKMTLTKAAAREAVKALSPADSIGVISFDSDSREIVPLQPVGGRTHIMPMISKIQSDGGTVMYPAMQMGFRELQKSDASVKHMIVLTDGQTSPDNFAALTRDIKNAGITVTSIAIGTDADVNLMRQIASAGGGKLFHVLSPKAIPQVVMREARRVARPLIYENNSGLQPKVEIPHAILSGLDYSLPSLTGFVMSTPKESPLVQTIVTSPLPQGQQNPLLSVWQYGLGRTAVFATDGGQRWSTSWTQWPGHEKFFAQLVRWLMRPTGDTGKFLIATQVRNGQVQVIVNALDKEDAYVNFLKMNGSVLGPDLKPIALEMQQAAPGRYVGTFAAERAGSYFVNVVPEGGTTMLSTGINVPFGDEFRVRDVNHALLQTLAGSKPQGGDAGLVFAPLGDLGGDQGGDQGIEEPLKQNPFREGLGKAGAIQDVWPWLVLIGCCLFLGDVFIRRVAVGMGWAYSAWDAIRGKAGDPVPVARLDSLLKSKERLNSQLERDRAATKFEFEANATTPTTDSAQKPRPAVVLEPRSTEQTPVTGANSASENTVSYTERLLEAKRKAKK